ncbi:MAG: carboxypeptidase regulatory-like domain-containing protein [Pirellulales bacterium]|nr:carboxypeptidase regulatory-like domain-containing protein [Pirellulales bacterium]
MGGFTFLPICYNIGWNPYWHRCETTIEELTMRVLATWIARLCVIGTIGTTTLGGETISGVYINKDHPEYRIEFLPGGKAIESFKGHLTSGTYNIEAGECVLMTGPSETPDVYRCRIVGNHLISKTGCRWVPRGEIHVVPWQNTLPVTIVVKDHRTSEPVSEFGYSYEIDTGKAHYDPLLVRPTPVRSESGTFTLQAPPACRISMTIYSPDVIKGTRQFDLTSENKARRIEIPVVCGVTVHGVVVDADLQKPLPGVQVSPVLYKFWRYIPDRRRSVTTDAEGRFTVRGIALHTGIHAEHRDYLECRSQLVGDGIVKDGPEWTGVRIELKTGERITGTVKTPDGKPLAGVLVSDGLRKRVLSKTDGTFTLLSPGEYTPVPLTILDTPPKDKAPSFAIRFEKKGYVFQKLTRTAQELRNIQVIMDPRPVLRGRVVDPEGRPVTNGKVFVGPGQNPPDNWCVSKEVDQTDGTFSLSIEPEHDYHHERRFWVGVSSPDFAVWETHLDPWKGSKSLTIRLKPGMSLTGKVQLLEHAKGPVHVRLTPVGRPMPKDVPFVDRGLPQYRECGLRKATADQEGHFRLKHVVPGKYNMKLSGPHVAPQETSIVVRQTSRDVGTFTLKGVGTIVGQLFDKNGKPARFAYGMVYSDVFADSNAWQGWKTDEEGRFRVEKVPAGRAKVCPEVNGVPRCSRVGWVVPGQTTEVRIRAPDARQSIAFRFVDREGSNAAFISKDGALVRYQPAEDRCFHIELVPQGNMPCSYPEDEWHELSVDGRIVLKDVTPNKYRVRIAKCQGSYLDREDNIIYDADLELTDEPHEVRISLGTGFVKGSVRSPKGTATAHVFALRDGGKRPEHLHTEKRGNFRFRYLTPGEYRFWATDGRSGWAHTQKTVKNKTLDLGILLLQPGGTVKGIVRFNAQPTGKETVQAVHESGVSVGAPDYKGGTGKPYTISGLWPGAWVVILRQGDRILAKQVVQIDATETQTRNLVEEAKAPSADTP